MTQLLTLSAALCIALLGGCRQIPKPYSKYAAEGLYSHDRPHRYTITELQEKHADRRWKPEQGSQTQGAGSSQWLVYGHSAEFYYDDNGKLVIIVWYNTNPGPPPDAESGICWGPFQHWAYADDLNYWTTAWSCNDSTQPGYWEGSFYAR